MAWELVRSGHLVRSLRIITTPALLASLLLAASIPQAPVLVGLGPQWTVAHLRWSGILVGATCVLLAAMRDPAARRA